MAGDLDVSGKDPGSVKEALTSVVSLLAIRQQVPGGNLLYSQQPKVMLTAEATAGSDWKSSWATLPGMWSSILVTRNLLLSAGINNTEVGKDNAHSFGPAITTSWGNDSTKNFVTLGTNYVKGPDDFYYQNINISLQKKMIIKDWQVVFGFTKHFNRLEINVKDNPDPENNYKCEKRISLNHIRAGVYKKFEHLAYGLEANVSRQLVGMSLTVTGFLP
ncbi:MAG: hypothetical protein K9M80_02530 [Candidatus Marinimicrobia bacterium]|nr:hypothetical protein [Candidatus Neomarinimicrobiota bacterium]